MKVDMSPEAVWRRIEAVGRLSNLTASRRLDTKVSMRPDDVGRRIRKVSELRDLCLELRARRTP